MAARFVFPEGSLDLNEEQALIVRQPAMQAMRILASAGSGKTTTLTARIAHLLTNEGAQPSEIILLTFTHNAAVVMKQRLQALVGARRILCGTFHALSQQILREQAPAALNDVYHVDELPLKALDFLRSPAGVAWIRGIRWIFIDEFQDINDTQYDFIRALHHTPGATVTIVGDDAQNIYSWRGSCVDYILNFHKRFDSVMDFQLSTNYRSTRAIVAVANSIMRYIPTLPHKEMMTAAGATAATASERPTVHYFARTSEERDWVCETAIKLSTTGTTVILSKFNSVLYAYEETLLKAGAHPRFVSGDQVSAENGSIYLSTFHGSKGLEWDNVFLVRMNDEVFPQQKDEASVLQERRLFYVAVTRARRGLTFTYSRNDRSLSRFVREIHRPLLVWHRLPQYELSEVSSAATATSVADWIGYLTGEDDRAIKALGVLPAFPGPEPGTNPSTSTNTSPYITPYWWTEQGLAAEFFNFLRAFWHREIAATRPESGGQWDRDAQRVVWTIKIAAEDAALFETYRPLFEVLMDRFFGTMEPGSAPPQIYYTDILAAIHAEAPGTAITQADMIRIIQIIHKMRTMLYNLRFASVRLTDLQFAPIRHSPPQESRCDLIRAWRIYTSGSGEGVPETETEQLDAVYKIGLCQTLATGRSGVLVNLPGAREWGRCREFLKELRARAAGIAADRSRAVLCRVLVSIVPGVHGVADMLVGSTAWFFVGGDSPTELQRLDRALQILLTVHAMRVAGHIVTEICLFQMITGLTVVWPLTGWTQSSSSLMTAFVEARVAFGSSLASSSGLASGAATGLAGPTSLASSTI
jgi:hypothetical protein